MDLGKTWIRERRAPLVGAPDRRGVGSLCVGREIEDVAVPAGGKYHRLCCMGLDSTGDEIPGDDATGHSVDHDEIEHLGSRKHLHRTRSDLSLQRLVRTEKQLLARLSARIERPRALRATERSVGE